MLVGIVISAWQKTSQLDGWSWFQLEIGFNMQWNVVTLLQENAVTAPMERRDSTSSTKSSESFIPVKVSSDSLISQCLLVDHSSKIGENERIRAYLEVVWSHFVCNRWDPDIVFLWQLRETCNCRVRKVLCAFTVFVKLSVWRYSGSFLDYNRYNC